MLSSFSTLGVLPRILPSSCNTECQQPSSYPREKKVKFRSNIRTVKHGYSLRSIVHRGDSKEGSAVASTHGFSPLAVSMHRRSRTNGLPVPTGPNLKGQTLPDSIHVQNNQHEEPMSQVTWDGSTTSESSLSKGSAASTSISQGSRPSRQREGSNSSASRRSGLRRSLKRRPHLRTFSKLNESKDKYSVAARQTLQKGVKRSTSPNPTIHEQSIITCGQSVPNEAPGSGKIGNFLHSEMSDGETQQEKQFSSMFPRSIAPLQEDLLHGEKHEKSFVLNGQLAKQFRSITKRQNHVGPCEASLLVNESVQSKPELDEIVLRQNKVENRLEQTSKELEAATKEMRDAEARFLHRFEVEHQNQEAAHLRFDQREEQVQDRLKETEAQLKVVMDGSLDARAELEATKAQLSMAIQETQKNETRLETAIDRFEKLRTSCEQQHQRLLERIERNDGRIMENRGDIVKLRSSMKVVTSFFGVIGKRVGKLLTEVRHTLQLTSGSEQDGALTASPSSRVDAHSSKAVGSLTDTQKLGMQVTEKNLLPYPKATPKKSTAKMVNSPQFFDGSIPSIMASATKVTEPGTKKIITTKNHQKVTKTRTRKEVTERVNTSLKAISVATATCRSSTGRANGKRSATSEPEQVFVSNGANVISPQVAKNQAKRRKRNAFGGGRRRTTAAASARYVEDSFAFLHH